MKTILCYGDSNTYGYDPRSFLGERYGADTRWTGILNQAVEAKVVNEGLNGRCIPQTKYQVQAAAGQIAHYAAESDAVQVWIMLGTNDLLMNPELGAEGTAARMKTFLTLLLQEKNIQKGHIVLKLLVPPRIQSGTWVESEKLCEESGKLGDFYESIAGALGLPCIRTDRLELPVLYDGVHLSEEGHKRLAEYLIRKAQGEE